MFAFADMGFIQVRPLIIPALVAWTVLSLAVGCGGAQSGRAGDAAPPTPQQLYPLAKGNVWSYSVDTGHERVLSISRVVSSAGNQYEVSNNRSPSVKYEVRAEGIYQPAHEAWLLRGPIAVGREWDAASGRTARIRDVDMSMNTQAGTFRRCVRVEETGGADGRKVVTTYCPDVGPVAVHASLVTNVTQMKASVRATLLGYQLN